ncbi:hypothetical protein D3C77_614050 [compost metagenome]
MLKFVNTDTADPARVIGRQLFLLIRSGRPRTHHMKVTGQPDIRTGGPDHDRIFRLFDFPLFGLDVVVAKGLIVKRNRYRLGLSGIDKYFNKTLQLFARPEYIARLAANVQLRDFHAGPITRVG